MRSYRGAFTLTLQANHPRVDLPSGPPRPFPSDDLYVIRWLRCAGEGSAYQVGCAGSGSPSPAAPSSQGCGARRQAPGRAAAGGPHLPCPRRPPTGRPEARLTPPAAAPAPGTWRRTSCCAPRPSGPSGGSARWSLGPSAAPPGAAAPAPSWSGTGGERGLEATREREREIERDRQRQRERETETDKDRDPERKTEREMVVILPVIGCPQDESQSGNNVSLLL